MRILKPTVAHAELSGVSDDQHHTKLHASAHAVGSTDPFDHNAAHEPGGVDPMATDAVAATASLRTLGTGATQALPGQTSYALILAGLMR